MERNHRRVQDRIKALKRQWEKEGAVCWACGTTLRYDSGGYANSVEADHNTALASGGHVLGPMRPACRTCNRRRKDMDADAFYELINNQNINGKSKDNKGNARTPVRKEIPKLKRPPRW